MSKNILIFVVFVTFSGPVYAQSPQACGALAGHATARCNARVTCPSDPDLVQQTRAALAVCSADPHLHSPGAPADDALARRALDHLIEGAGGVLAFQCCLAIPLSRP